MQDLHGLERGADSTMKLYATRHSHAELYLHAVWTTKNRVVVLDRSLLSRLSRQAADTSKMFGAVVLAFGGVADHVHILLRYRPDLSVAALVRGIKASLTRTVRRDVATLPDFAWQAGYGAFSVGASELDRAASYVSNQAHHHAVGTLWPEVEIEE